MQDGACGAREKEGSRAALVLSQCLSSPLCCLPPPLLAKARQASLHLGSKTRLPTMEEMARPAPAPAPPPPSPRDTISPGTLVVLSIDPCASLAPLLTVDGSLEKKVRSMEAGMRYYLAFVRHVENPTRTREFIGEIDEKNRRPSFVGSLRRPGAPAMTKERVRRTHLQLCLLYHKPPKKSRYDDMDESMCTPLEWEGQHRWLGHLSAQSSPLRSSFGDERTPLRVDGPAETLIPASCRQLYAYTTMNVTAVLSSLDEGTERAAPRTTLSISEQEMQRFDVHRNMDRLREEEGCDEDTSSEGGELEDCELSTVISGPSSTGVGGVLLNGAQNYLDPPLVSPTTAVSRDSGYDELDSAEPSRSTQPTTLPSYNSSEEEEEEQRRARGAVRLEPWSVGRQGTLHVRVWLDIESALRKGRPMDPRGLLEDLRKLQRCVRFPVPDGRRALTT